MKTNNDMDLRYPWPPQATNNEDRRLIEAFESRSPIDKIGYDEILEMYKFYKPYHKKIKKYTNSTGTFLSIFFSVVFILITILVAQLLPDNLYSVFICVGVIGSILFGFILGNIVSKIYVLEKIIIQMNEEIRKLKKI
jgi:uncharacterized membrane protein (DUF485 family)